MVVLRNVQYGVSVGEGKVELSGVRIQFVRCMTDLRFLQVDPYQDRGIFVFGRKERGIFFFLFFWQDRGIEMAINSCFLSRCISGEDLCAWIVVRCVTVAGLLTQRVFTGHMMKLIECSKCRDTSISIGMTKTQLSCPWFNRNVTNTVSLIN